MMILSLAHFEFCELFITNNIELALLTIVETKTKMATFGTWNEFSGIKKDWSFYYERCVLYCVSNNNSR